MDEQNQNLVGNETNTSIQRRRPITHEALERLRKLREEIIKDRGGKPFEEDSTEILRKEREKRTEQLMQAATSQYGKDPYEEDTPEEQAENAI